MRNSKGFTLIELLIVVVIIGILAAIAIPRFAQTKGKAYDAAAKTDLRNAMTSQEAYFSDNQTYGGTSDINASTSPSVTFSATGSSSAYTMTASHDASDTSWCVNSGSGNVTKCS